MNLVSMFAVAKKINSFNQQLKLTLSPPLNQIKIAQIIDNKVILVAENQAILNFAKGQQDILLNFFNSDLGLGVTGIEVKIIL